MRLSERLTQLRIELGMTQKELADRLGVSRGTVGMYEVFFNQRVKEIHKRAKEEAKGKMTFIILFSDRILLRKQLFVKLRKSILISSFPTSVFAGRNTGMFLKLPAEKACIVITEHFGDAAYGIIR